MNAAKAARGLGINERTLKAWIDRPELSPFFSTGARRETKRDITDDDFVVANTVRVLREGVPNNMPNWDTIAARLASGHRERQFPPEAATVDSGLSVLAQHEHVVAITIERDIAIKRVADLEAKLSEAQREHRADNERLLREIGDLKAAIARLEAEKAKGE